MKLIIVLLLPLLSSAIKDIICPDGKSLCFESQTCCVLSSGNYGCCPLPQAVCCNDHTHCCPTNYKCNLQSMTCDRQGRQIPMLEHQIARTVPKMTPIVSPKHVLCPGGRDFCPDGSTCCTIGKDEYACCPMVKAVCCADNVHCCPNGYKCDIAAGGCVRQDRIIPLARKLPAKTMGTGDVICSNRATKCPDGNTCCEVEKGEFGCCPMPNAVCCSDNEHCCPHGFTCDVEERRCIVGAFSVPMIKKIKSNKKRSPLKKIDMMVLLSNSKQSNPDITFCPDHKSSCPGEFTCCLTKTGSWGCCPLKNAKCCKDGEHCCPHGTKCDLVSMKCTPESRFEMLSITKPSALSKIKVGTVICPDGISECPTGYTCCLLSSGMYGCCPYSNAVCCSDHVHCCPHGTTCDVTSGMCLRKEALELVKLEQKQPNYLIHMVSYNDILCPDKTSSCSSGYTCCKLATGSYGCCPLPKAVCCSDGKHCCPHGTTCDLSSGRCLQGNDFMAMVKKVASTPVSQNEVCPDGKSSCPSGNTCCKLATGGYGCCPLPKAVCCSDGKHCCPHGTTCDLSSGRCLQGNDFMAMVKKVASTPVSQNEVCSDGKSSCPSGSTCCKLATGGYGCCPLPKAVCCSDGKHCCPHGTTCDLSSGRCLQGNDFMAMVKKVASTPVSQNEVCPDGKSSCPSGSTCCKLATGGYGCCPLPKAVCCSDGEHCCPHGTTCDLSTGRCLQGNDFMAMVKKVASTPVSQNEVCPDGKSSCPSGSTCCKLATGGYGCCPLPKAVCCSDGEHCCPHGTTCDLSSGRCLQGNDFMAMVKKVASTPVSQNEVCPDGKSSCPSGSTCCKLATGGYGCCPLPKAVCCSDGKHCCPHGTTCDLSTGRCLQGNDFMAMVKKVASTPVSQNEVCPDGKSSCPSGSTCCKLATGGYGCCPLPKAVCCSDGEHCCPHGTTCDLSTGRCLQGNDFMAMVKKVASTPVSQNEVCPDGKSSCPSGSTCCKLATGGYGCCPLPKAVCCSDGKHCCPHGTTCDLSTGRCLQGNDFMAMVKKVASTPVSQNEVCPDGKSSCPSGNTCCKLATGGYGCCPLPKAVCCSDGEHCCPHGTTCDLSTGRCLQGNDFMAMVKKVASTPVSQNEVCPDGKSSCPSGSTCCKLATGGYGCCPLPKAVCCSDGEHCCPHGTTCDLSSGRCLQGNDFIAMVKKVASTPVSQNEVCPDGKSSCPSGSTCCKLATGGYGCCPLPKAVCCSDGIHCCPQGYSCSGGTCVRSRIGVNARKYILALTIADSTKANDGKFITCPDEKTRCVAGTTCCQDSVKTSYSCCPIKDAICCKDHIHCCPNGWKCDTEQGTCYHGKTNQKIPLLKKTSGKTVAAVKKQKKYDPYIRF